MPKRDRKIILPKRNLVLPNKTLFIPCGVSRARQRGFMRLMPSIGLWGGQRNFTVDGAFFEGSTPTYRTLGTSFSGLSDGKTGIWSCWYRVQSTSFVNLILTGVNSVGGGNDQMSFGIDQSGSQYFVAVRGRRSDNLLLLQLESNTLFSVGTTWHHVLAAWDLAAGTAEMYIDGVSDVFGTTKTVVNDNIRYAEPDWGFGARPTAGLPWDGDVCEVYFAGNQFIDITSSTNREKWRSSGGAPVTLGAQGHLPTGTAPTFYAHISEGENVENIAINRGSGGGTFTGGGGTITRSSSHP